MTPTNVKEFVTERWDRPLSDVCVKILDFLESVPREHLQMLTFTTLTKAAGKKNFDLDVVAAANILSSSEISALKAHAAFVDENDEFHEVALSELTEARRVGTLVHPETGELIRDFERLVILYFSIAPDFEIGI